MNLENIIKGAVASIVGGIIVKAIFDKVKEVRQDVLELEVIDEELIDEKQ